MVMMLKLWKAIDRCDLLLIELDSSEFYCNRQFLMDLSTPVDTWTLPNMCRVIVIMCMLMLVIYILIRCL